MALSKEKIQTYKERLEKEKKKILSEIEENRKSLDFGNDVETDQSEEADEYEERGNELAVESVLQKRIAAIDAALTRIGEGSYGICTKCDMEISEKILDIAPESTLCERCKRG